MSELITARITAHAARLGLRHLAASAPALIQRAHDAQLGYADFLDLILGEEAAAKDDRRFTSALHITSLPHHKTIDDFDFTFQPDLDVRKIKDLATLDFATQAANIALLGPPGTGKTHLAVALAVAACASHHLRLLHRPRQHGPQAPQRRPGQRPRPPASRLPAHIPS